MKLITKLGLLFGLTIGLTVSGQNLSLLPIQSTMLSTNDEMVINYGITGNNTLTGTPSLITFNNWWQNFVSAQAMYPASQPNTAGQVFSNLVVNFPLDGVVFAGITNTVTFQYTTNRNGGYQKAKYVLYANGTNELVNITNVNWNHITPLQLGTTNFISTNWWVTNGTYFIIDIWTVGASETNVFYTAQYAN